MKTNPWYQNPAALAGAIEFCIRYRCCYGWAAVVSNKTPCCNYKEGDHHIPEDLRQAIRDYLANLSRKQYLGLNRNLALELGERFFVRREAIVKLLSRLLADGDPRHDRELLRLALEIQIDQREELLAAL